MMKFLFLWAAFSASCFASTPENSTPRIKIHTPQKACEAYGSFAQWDTKSGRCVHELELFCNYFPQIKEPSFKETMDVLIYQYKKASGSNKVDCEDAAQFWLHLKILLVGRRSFSNLLPLRGMVHLESLIANNTQISDIKPLFLLPNLKFLALMGTPVKDPIVVAQYFFHAKNLSQVYLINSPVSYHKSYKSLRKLGQSRKISLI